MYMYTKTFEKGDYLLSSLEFAAVKIDTDSLQVN